MNDTGAEVLVCASVAVQRTSFDPIANTLPDGGTQLAAKCPSTASLANTSKVTVAPSGPVASTVASSCGSTTGAVICRTSTWKVLVPTTLKLFFAVQVTVVSPSAKVDPETGKQLATSGPSTSIAVASG